MGQAISDLFNLIILAVAAVEDFLRGLLANAGVPGQLQAPVLIAWLLLLMLASLRLLGGILAGLIIAVLALLVAHVLAPGMHV